MAKDVKDFPVGAQREALVTDLVSLAVATGSNLMGGQRAAWADLRPPEHREAATALLLGLEEAAFLLANNLHHEKTVTHAEHNIREYCILLYYFSHNTLHVSSSLVFCSLVLLYCPYLPFVPYS